MKPSRKIVLVIAGNYQQYVDWVDKDRPMGTRSIFVYDKHRLMGMDRDTPVVLAGTYWTNPALSEARQRGFPIYMNHLPVETRPLKIYIAGPYSHETRAIRRINTEMAMDAALNLIQRGHFPFCPHLSHFLDEHYEAHMNASLPWQVWMDCLTAFLPDCDALLYLGPSKGADIEKQMAEDRGMPIYFAEEEVPTYREITKGNSCDFSLSSPSAPGSPSSEEASLLHPFRSR